MNEVVLEHILLALYDIRYSIDHKAARLDKTAEKQERQLIMFIISSLHASKEDIVNTLNKVSDTCIEGIMKNRLYAIELAESYGQEFDENKWNKSNPSVYSCENTEMFTDYVMSLYTTERDMVVTKITGTTLPFADIADHR
jgi:hypothetical protein